MEVGWSGVVLHTPSLDEVEEFYRSVLGIPTRRVGGGLEAGWGRPLILVREGEGALPGGYIYHVAIRVPSREALGAFIKHVLADYPDHVEGFADHLVSESVYLRSPDGIGFEVYADRPTGEWIREGALVAMDTLPLDLDGLTRDAAPSPLPPGAEIGHIHMRAYVDLDAAVAFYRKLSMAVTWKMPDAVFLAWGGYHHHVAFNRWPLQRPRGALAAVYTPAVSRPVRDPLGVELLPAGEKLPG